MGVIQEINNGLFTKSLTHEYRLSLNIGTNGISYMIYDSLNKVFYYKKIEIKEKEDYIQSIKNIFAGEEKLHLPYKIVKLSLNSHSFTLMPKRLFKKDDISLYLNTTGELNNKESFLSFDEISFNSCYLAYAWGKEMTKLLKNYFPNSSMHHKVTCLIHGWHEQSKLKEGNKVYIHVDLNYFTISFFREKNLIFINRFQYNSAADFLYYVLMVYSQFELKPDNDPLFISGNIVQNSEIYQKLYRYIRHIQFISSPAYFDFDKSFVNLSHYFNFDLYSLKLCE